MMIGIVLETLQREHEQWTADGDGADEFARAHRLALTLRDLGDDAELIEHHLMALGCPATVAGSVADNARRL